MKKLDIKVNKEGLESLVDNAKSDEDLDAIQRLLDFIKDNESKPDEE